MIRHRPAGKHWM